MLRNGQNRGGDADGGDVKKGKGVRNGGGTG
jgi:hypothetical protein